MGGNSKLFSFVFLTIKRSANDPKAKNFLPTLLSGIQRDGGPLLPLKEDSWTIGQLGGTSGLGIAKTIADNYFQINNTPVIPYPKNPDPSLDLKDAKGVDKVVINGLENVYVTDFANYDYDEATATVTADLKMQFNYWTLHPEGLQPGQKISALSLNTPFVLTQYLCASESPTSTACINPDADPIQIVGNGSFSADISQMNFTAGIKIKVGPNRSGLDLSITRLKLVTTGADAPTFQNVNAQLWNESDFQDIISELITSFMSAQDASTAVFAQMEASLNSADNIGALTSTLSAQVGAFLDARLGAVTGPLPSDEGQKSNNLVDLYLFDRIRYSLNNPASSWYVKTLLDGYQNPSLNPFRPEDLNIGSFEIFAGFNLDNVTLSGIVIEGFPNATVPAEQMILAPPSLTLTVMLGSLSSGTTATANFSATYSNGSGRLSFGIRAAIQSIALTSVVTPSGDDASELNLTFNSIGVTLPSTSALQISISDQSGMGPAVQKILNTPPIQAKIVSAINSQFQSHLKDISNEVTSLIKAMLNQQLGAK